MAENQKDNQGQSTQKGQQQNQQNQKEQSGRTGTESNTPGKTDKGTEEEGTKMPGRETRTPVAEQGSNQSNQQGQGNEQNQNNPSGQQSENRGK
jgi:hypothetical protein